MERVSHLASEMESTMKRGLSLKSVFFLLLVSSVSSAKASLPSDAKKLIESLPNKAITLDVVLGRAIQSSESYRQVLAQFPLVEVPVIQARAAFDPIINAKYEWSDNRNETTNPAMPTNLKGSTYGLGISSYFATGTGVSVDLESGSSEFQFATQAGTQDINNFQTRMTLGIAQNLWKDAFGSATRSNEDAAERQKAAALAQFYDSIESWSFGIMNVFYDAWLAKMRAMAMQENLRRREKLERIMQLKIRRGTAELPDLLQVKSAHTAAKIQESEAMQNLKDRWQGLVLNLKLPESWLDIDPRLIPIDVDDPITSALQICRNPPSKLDPENAPNSVKRVIEDAKAADQRLRAAESMAKPDLKLRAAATFNGVDNVSRQTTFDEARNFENPGYSVGLQLTYPLYSRTEEAQYRSALAEKSRAEASARNAEDQWKLDWISGCSNLKRLSDSVSQLREARENQLRRARLDEQRFEIGRTQIFSVVQAGDDATLADLNLRTVEVQLRLAAWRIHRLNDGMKAYFQSLEKKAPLKL